MGKVKIQKEPQNTILQEENNQNGEILWKLTWELINDRQWDRALLVGKHLVSIDPDVPAAHVALGNAWMGVNDLDKAEGCFRKALELDAEEVSYLSAHSQHLRLPRRF